MTDETGQSIGTARMDVVVDTSSFDAAILASERRVTSMSQAAQQAYSQLDAAEKRRVDSLIKQADAIGLTREQQILYNAALKGVPTAILDELKNKLSAVQQATQAISETQEQATARIRDTVKASLDRVNADNAAIAASQRATAATDAQRAAYQRVGAAQSDAASIAARGQQILDAEARARKLAAGSAVDQAAALSILLGKIDPTEAALSRLDKMEQQLAAHRKAGTLSQDDYTAYASKIEVARAELTKADAAVSHFSLTSSGAGREFGILVGEIARGDFSNFQGSLFTLANRTGVLSALMSPLALGIGGVVAELVVFGAAAADVYEQEQKLNQAIAASGNFAGVTAGNLNQMAEGVGAATGGIGKARDILIDLVQQGRVGASALQAVGQAAYDVAELTGKSAKDAATDVSQYFDGTTASLLKANDQYHFVTASIYDQVKALEEEGNTQEAVRVAATAFHDQIGPRIDTMRDQVYGVAAAWRGAKEALSDYGSKAATAAGLILGTASDQDRIYELLGRKQAAQEGGGGILNGLILGKSFDSDDQAQLEQLQAKVAAAQDTAAAQAARAQAQTEQLAADKNIDKTIESIDKLSEKKKALAELDAQFLTLWKHAGDTGVVDQRLADVTKTATGFTGGAYDTARKAIEQRYKPAADHTGAADNSAQLAGFKQDLQGYVDAYTNSQRELDAERKSGAVSEADYYTQAHALLWKSSGEQVDAIQAEIDALQRRKVAGVDAIRNEQEIATLRAQLRKVDADTISKDNQLSEQQIAQRNKETSAIEAYAAALDKSNNVLQRQVNAEIARIGMGDQEYALQQKINQAYADQADKIEERARALQDGQLGKTGGITQATYDTDLAKLQAATDQRVAIIQGGYDAQRAAEGDWQNGLKRGYENWADQAKNVAGQVAAATTSAFDEFNNELINGAFNFHTFAISVLKDIEKIALQLAEQKAVAAIVSAFAPGATGGDTTQDLGSAGNTGYLSGKYNAMGGVYSSPSLSVFSNGVYDSPQMFAFANGAGIFGEAGPEAIMPLTRGPDGKLGVQSSGGGGGLTLNQTFNMADGSSTDSGSSTGNEDAYRQFMARMATVAKQEIASALRQGGILNRAGVRA
jgi:lambda family phage tail tape measure protein